MANCELMAGCLFFNDKMKDTQGVGALFKQKYCLGDSSDCARFMVAKNVGRTEVPENLYPNMLEKAKSIILAA